MMLIGVVSDTHIPVTARRLPPDLLAGLRGVGMVLHAGDLEVSDPIVELEGIAPTTAVAGNMYPSFLRGEIHACRHVTG